MINTVGKEKIQWPFEIPETRRVQPIAEVGAPMRSRASFSPGCIIRNFPRWRWLVEVCNDRLAGGRMRTVVADRYHL